MSRVNLEQAVAMWIGGHIDEVAASSDAATDRDGRRAQLQAEVDGLFAQRLAVELKLGRVASGYAEGLLDATGYRVASADTVKEQEALDTRVSELMSALDALLPVGEDVHEILAQGSDDLGT